MLYNLMGSVVLFYESSSLHFKIREKGRGGVSLFRILYGKECFDTMSELYKLETYLDDSATLNELIEKQVSEEFPQRIAIITDRQDLFLLANLYEKLFQPCIPVNVFKNVSDANCWMDKSKLNRKPAVA